MFSIGVVHLVRQCNEISAFREFIDSYRSHPAGIEHDLILVFKGFDNETIPDEYRENLSSIRHQALFVGDEGFDLGAYFTASTRLDHQFLCFLNSYSQILSENWLKKLAAPLSQSQIGIVGASASYQSHYNSYLYLLSHPTPDVRPARWWLRRLGGRYLRSRHLAYYRKHFAPYPNYHLRTNAFMLSRTLMLSLQTRPFRTKADALAFESDRNSLTRQIMARGLETLVVGRDGRTFAPQEWPQSHTFCSGSQENLLIGDNQTRLYDLADEAGRREYYKRTWELLS